MCGIVGAVAERNIVPVLLEGLRRLEYRGYDSAGLAVLQADNSIALCRTVGKVSQLAEKLEESPSADRLGGAHTRSATHDRLTGQQAHRHATGDPDAGIH